MALNFIQGFQYLPRVYEIQSSDFHVLFLFELLYAQNECFTNCTIL